MIVYIDVVKVIKVMKGYVILEGGITFYNLGIALRVLYEVIVCS